MHEYKWCDKQVDCVANEIDERDCPCSADEYRCNNGKCMRPSVACNGKCDCLECEDEAECGELFYSSNLGVT